MTTGGRPSLPAPYRLLCYEAIGSTNDEAKRLARAGAAAGTVVWALLQSAGRGRRGRPWVSPRGNLYFSLVLRPDCTASRAAQLGFVAAIALGDALRPIAGPAVALQYKWPNDLLANGRKIAGILLESETCGSDRLAFAILGVGVNLAVAPPAAEYPATSLAGEGVRPIEPHLLLDAVICRFDGWSRRWREEGFAVVREAWLAGAANLGEDIRVRLDRASFAGRFLDIDGEGALILQHADGRRRVAAGEVFPAG